MYFDLLDQSDPALKFWPKKFSFLDHLVEPIVVMIEFLKLGKLKQFDKKRVSNLTSQFLKKPLSSKIGRTLVNQAMAH